MTALSYGGGSNVCIYMYVCMYVYMYMYTYIYTYIHHVVSDVMKYPPPLLLGPCRLSSGNWQCVAVVCCSSVLQ